MIPARYRINYVWYLHGYHTQCRNSSLIPGAGNVFSGTNCSHALLADALGSAFFSVCGCMKLHIVPAELLQATRKQGPQRSRAALGEFVFLLTPNSRGPQAEFLLSPEILAGNVGSVTDVELYLISEVRSSSNLTGIENSCHIAHASMACQSDSVDPSNLQVVSESASNQIKSCTSQLPSLVIIIKCMDFHCVQAGAGSSWAR